MRNRIENYIRLLENRCYPNGLPDEVPMEINDMVPNYRRIAIAILRNDVALKSLGFTPPKSEWYNRFKKIEIEARGNNALQS